MHTVITRQQAEQIAWDKTDRDYRAVNANGERCLMTRDERSMWTSYLVRLLPDAKLTSIINPWGKREFVIG